jgi:hypothetical protein
MNFAMFGGFGKRPLAPGWRRETAVAVFGGGELDLVAAPPADGARLTAVAILGGISVTVPTGSRVTMSGISLFGGRDIKIRPGEGPEIRVRAVAVLGGVEIKDPSESAGE